MGLNYYASSPVLVAPQSSAMAGQYDGIASDPSSFQSEPPAKKFISKYPPPPSLNYLAQSSNGIAGRKRSRDDTGEEDHTGEMEASSRPLAVQATKPKPEPIMGPGMTLIYPEEPALNISPESQSGTWMEEKAENEDANAPPERPKMVARKSQRRIEDGSSLGSTMENTEIDPVVLHLGIGWRSLSAADPVVAGSENFIKRQFAVSEPRIILQHEGLEIYVVRTEPVTAQGYWSQFWVFREDLKSCRFLCNDESDLLRRLNNKRQDERGNWIPNILYEGPEVFAKHLSCAVDNSQNQSRQPSEDIEMLEVSA